MRYQMRNWHRQRAALLTMLALWGSCWVCIVIANWRGANLDDVLVLLHPPLLLVVGLVVGMGGSEPGGTLREVRAWVAGLALSGLIVATHTALALVDTRRKAAEAFGSYVPQLLLWFVAGGLVAATCGVMLGVSLARAWRERRVPMLDLWRDIRAHPLATALLLTLWGATTWLVGVSYAISCSLLLLLPAGLAAFLVGRWRRARGACTSGLAAALIVSPALLDLSLAALLVDDRLRSGRWLLEGDWGILILVAPLVQVPGFVIGYVGWLIGHEAVYPEEASTPVG